MDNSLSSWLALREPADHQARSETLTNTLVAALPRTAPLRILDLGTGTGSNIRYLAPRLPRPQHWVAVDRDPDLIAQLPREVDKRCAELGPLDDPDLFTGRHLVTASALLDLASVSWIDALADRCRAANASVLFALNYDGRSVCSPHEAEDDTIRAIFNRHQNQSDKGFGPAAGPDASEAAVRAFSRAGYQVLRERTDWQLEPDAAAIQRKLIAGWADAAMAIAPEQSQTIRNWLARRLSHVDAQRSRIVVGHEDIAAWLPQPPDARHSRVH